MKKIRVFFMTSVLVMLLTAFALAEVVIGTGGMQGIYYPTGNDICDLVEAAGYGIDCEAVSSGGSIYNINMVTNGFWEFGIAQSDRQYNAWNGLGYWAGNPKENLRSVFSIHYESVTLVAAVDAGIETIQDLIGKKVNLGAAISGGYQNAIQILSYAGIDPENDIDAYEYGANDAATEFQNRNLDALFITIGHPSNYIRNLVDGGRRVYFVPIDLEGFTDAYPYFAMSTIIRKNYKKAANNKDVPTVGVKATFITSIDVDDELVYVFTKEVLGNFSYFQGLHPTREELTKNNMLKALTAPIHPGALKYYKEVIFIKSECDE